MLDTIIYSDYYSSKLNNLGLLKIIKHINQSINQSIDRSINRSINQSINRFNESVNLLIR